MIFDEEEIQFYKNDLKQMIDEFESLSDDIRQVSAQIEKEVQALYNRVLDIENLSEVEQEQLYEDLEAFYDIIESADDEFFFEEDEEFFDIDFEELEEIGSLDDPETVEKIQKFTEMLRNYVEVIAENAGDDASEEFKNEMNQVLSELSNPANFTPEKLREIDQKIHAIEDKFDSEESEY